MAYGFGIIGCGMIARFHAHAIDDVKGAKLVGCFDTVHAVGRSAWPPKPAARPIIGWTTCWPIRGFDIVTIGTPSGAHLEPAVAAAKAGKHVIVEKPLEITLKRCDAIIAACKKINVKLSAIFPSRFHDGSRELKRAVDAGRFGQLTLGDAYVKWFRTQAYYDSGAWRGTWELDGGGALMNQAIHSVDLLTWLMGPVAEVQAQTATLAHERIAVEDTAVATLRFANGALGVIEASTAAFPGYLKRIEINGSEGSAVLEEEDLTALGFRQEPEARRSDPPANARAPQHRRRGSRPVGHRPSWPCPAIRRRAQSDSHRRPAGGRWREGRRSVEIILAIYKSAESGRPVPLPLTSDPTLTARRRTK